jgi:hypothetical protein
VQRGAAIPVPGIDVGTSLDQTLGDVPVRVEHGHRQRHHFARVAQIHIGFVLEQDIDASDAIFTRRIE